MIDMEYGPLLVEYPLTVLDAAHLLAVEPVAVQLRYLQTLTEIGVEKNTTVVFPLPLELLRMIPRTVTSPPAKA